MNQELQDLPRMDLFPQVPQLSQALMVRYTILFIYCNVLIMMLYLSLWFTSQQLSAAIHVKIIQVQANPAAILL